MKPKNIIFESAYYIVYRIENDKIPYECSVWHKEGHEEYFKTSNDSKALTIIKALELASAIKEL